MRDTVEVLQIIADLMGEDCDPETSEYGRACVEIATDLLGLRQSEDRNRVEAILRAYQESR